MFDTRRVSRHVHLLTIHDHANILYETVDNLESLSRCCPRLILRESVQPLQDSIDVLLYETFLDKIDYFVLSKAICQR